MLAISDNHDVTSEWDVALDAVAVAPENHVVLFEDDDVRVLAVTLPPRAQEPLHHHRWPSVFVIHHMEPIRDFDEKGAEQAPPSSILEALAEGKVPLVFRMEPQPLHSVENLGAKPICGTRIEFKRGFPLPPSGA